MSINSYILETGQRLAQPVVWV